MTAQHFTSDSAYATWTPAEREAADCMEADFNMQEGARLAQMYADQGHPLREFTDDSLRRFRKEWTRRARGRSRPRCSPAQLHPRGPA